MAGLFLIKMEKRKAHNATMSNLSKCWVRDEFLEVICKVLPMNYSRVGKYTFGLFS